MSDIPEVHFPSHCPTNPTVASFGAGYGFYRMVDVVSSKDNGNASSTEYIFENQRENPQDILEAKEPSLPLLPPNEAFAYGLSLDFSDVFGRKAKVKVQSHYLNLCRMDPSLVFGPLVEQDLYSDWNTTISKCKTAISLLGDDLYLGCPKDLVVNELYSELEQQATDRFTNHPFHGGCLSYIPLPDFGHNVAGVLLYPSGAVLDILFISILSSYTYRSNMRLQPKLGNQTKQFQLGGVIRQIEAKAYPGEDKLYSIVRTDYQCHLLKISISEDGNDTTVQIVKTTCAQFRPTSVALSPFIPEEFVFAMDNSEVVFSDSGGILTTSEKFIGVQRATNPIFCHFGAHPRQVFVHDQEAAYIYDLRSSSLAKNTIYELPVPSLPSDQCFFVARQHPTNHFYHYMATQDALILVDQRFPKHSVLQTYHNLDGLPSHLEVSTYSKTRDIVMIGNHIEKQVHCFFVKNNAKSIPLLSSLPWKIGCYHDWVEAVDGVGQTGNLRIWERLDQPLLGIAACTVSDKNLSSWNVLQLSGAGDIFYQTFSSPGGRNPCRLSLNNGRSTEETTLSPASLRLCDLWLKPFTNCIVNVTEVADHTCRKRRLLEFHDNCKLCSNKECLISADLHHKMKCRRINIQIDETLLAERKSQLYKYLGRLVCKGCCEIEAKNLMSSGDIRVKRKGFLKCFCLPWEEEAGEVKTPSQKQKDQEEEKLWQLEKSTMRTEQANFFLDTGLETSSTSLPMFEKPQEMLPFSQSKLVPTPNKVNDGRESEDTEVSFTMILNKKRKKKVLRKSKSTLSSITGF